MKSFHSHVACKHNYKSYVYLDFEDFSNGCLKLFRVVEVCSDDMGFSDVIFSIRMLRRHLVERKKKSYSLPGENVKMTEH